MQPFSQRKAMCIRSYAKGALHLPAMPLDWPRSYSYELKMDCDEGVS